jgi:hypothetical protein
MKRFVVVVLLVMLAVAAIQQRFSRADTVPVPAASALPPNPFEGKFLFIYLDKEARTPSYVLTDASIQTIAGREFLTGVGADTKRANDWRTGVKTSIAWANVVTFMEFTQDEYDKICERYANAEAK